MQPRSPIFKNLVELKLKMDVLYQTNAYHQYLATLSSNMDAKKDVPNVASVRLLIYNALSFVPVEQLAKMDEISHIKT